MIGIESIFRFRAMRFVFRKAGAVALGLAAALSSQTGWAADPGKASPTSGVRSAPTEVAPEIPQSVFLVSSPTQAIKDPFYPNSTRFAAKLTKVTRTNVSPKEVAADLSLKAILGTPDRPLATINDTVFGVGEEQDVVTPLGRIHVRCVEIRLQDEIVIIEVAGSRRELRFSRRK